MSTIRARAPFFPASYFLAYAIINFTSITVVSMYVHTGCDVKT